MPSSIAYIYKVRVEFRQPVIQYGYFQASSNDEPLDMKGTTLFAPTWSVESIGIDENF